MIFSLPPTAVKKGNLIDLNHRRVLGLSGLLLWNWHLSPSLRERSESYTIIFTIHLLAIITIELKAQQIPLGWYQSLYELNTDNWPRDTRARKWVCDRPRVMAQTVAFARLFWGWRKHQYTVGKRRWGRELRAGGMGCLFLPIRNTTTGKIAESVELKIEQNSHTGTLL